MRADKNKIDLIMARKCISLDDIKEKSGMPLPTIKAVRYERNAKPVTIGIFARALGVDVTEILAD